MSFKDNSYLDHWRPLWLVERKRVCNFGRGHHEVQFCEVIVNLDQWLRRRCHFSYLELCGPFVWPSETICAILIDAIMRHNSVKLF